MLNVKVLGSGCANCKRLEQRVQKVLADHGLEGEVEKVTDYGAMMRWNILKTPGLVVDDVLVASGRIPNEDEIVGWLTK
ncbi:TM0996/MTH895 family glutaredoxin-like protein [Candidatus Chloroploca sp. M-50]|uniref:TM0996/MTH895 family glutaredoxin-like protein n=1 Tax=Candidatus Chloroploca mongolica TaxID=2528176 RepID=A0ABS4DFW2_9CHLR|nr:thioredoxin family protein [Candidatus Chloroploca mongolica]MBP1468254.1 TM0996/MTH895 family glutaredoxin-like protein [Candidatus Chloroploca mongolica]